MSREPTYPEDAPVDPPEPAAEAVRAAEASKAVSSNRTRHLVTGAAIGVGSAAIVAALLYANRSRKPDKS
ncbi:MAG TPA: hypothetical protein VIT45_12905 [Allosphingosinicella sp.]